MDDAVNNLSEASYGIHCIIIYPDLKTFRIFYSQYIQRQLEVKNNIVLINPFYETISSVRRTLSKGKKAIDVEKSENKDILILNDALREYFKHGNPLESKLDILDYSQRIGKSGLSIIADMGPFFFRMQYNDLVKYELSLPKHFDMTLNGLCSYHKDDFNRLEHKQRQKIINNHSMAIEIES